VVNCHERSDEWKVVLDKRVKGVRSEERSDEQEWCEKSEEEI